MESLLEVISCYKDPLKTAEFGGRTCYSSHPKIEEGSDRKFIGGIIRSGHESVIEHSRIVCKAHYGLQYLLPRLIAEHEIPLAFTLRERTESEFWGAVVSGNYRAWRDAYKALVADQNRYNYLYTEKLIARIKDMLAGIDPVLAEGLDA